MIPFKETISDFSGGLNRFKERSALTLSESPSLENVDVSIPGVLTPASTPISVCTLTGTQARGIAGYRNGGLSEEIIVATNTRLEKITYSGGSYSSSDLTTGLTSSTRPVRAVNAFLDDEYRMYFALEDQDDIRYYNGTTVSTISNYQAYNLAFFQQKLFLGQVEISGTWYRNRIIFSDEGADTFSADNFFDDIGDVNTGLVVYKDFLIIFTPYSVFEYDGYSLNRLEGYLGTIHPDTIQEIGGVLYWYSPNGVQAYGSDGLRGLISYPCGDSIKKYRSDTVIPSGRVLPTMGRIADQKLFLQTGTGESYIYDTLQECWSYVNTSSPHTSVLKYFAEIQTDTGSANYRRVSYAVNAANLYQLTENFVYTSRDYQAFGDGGSWFWTSAPIRRGDTLKKFTKVVIRHSNFDGTLSVSTDGTNFTSVIGDDKNGVYVFYLKNIEGTELTLKVAGSVSTPEDIKIYDITTYGTEANTPQSHG